MAYKDPEDAKRYAREYHARKRESDPTYLVRRRKSSRGWNKTHPEAMRASDARRYDPARTAAWRATNPAKLKEHQHRHYAKRKSRFLANNTKRRADKLQQAPPWADLKKIQEIYANCPPGYHVDHIIPLRGKEVRGLHVHYNLQYLPALENLRKSNKV